MKNFIYLILSVLFLYSCKKSNDGSSSDNPADSTSTGPVSTFVGSATSTPFNSAPTGICADSRGNFFVAEENGSVVVKITAKGATSAFAGSGVPGCENGTGTAATFTFPYQLCADPQDNIYVGDYICPGLKKISPQAVVSTFCSSDYTNQVYVIPQTICSDPQGNIYFVDQSGANGIVKATPAGVVSRIAGDGTTGYKDGATASAEFMTLSGICADGSGNIYVADAHRIRKISGGQVTTIAGNDKVGYADGTGAAAEFGGATGLCADAAGNIYVADVYNSLIRKVTANGVVTTVAGTGESGYKDGDYKSALFSAPTNLCIGTDGNLYVADSGNNLIRKIKLN